MNEIDLKSRINSWINLLVEVYLIYPCIQKCKGYTWFKNTSLKKTIFILCQSVQRRKARLKPTDILLAKISYWLFHPILKILDASGTRLSASILKTSLWKKWPTKMQICWLDLSVRGFLKMDIKRSTCMPKTAFTGLWQT